MLSAGNDHVVRTRITDGQDIRLHPDIRYPSAASHHGSHRLSCSRLVASSRRRPSATWSIHRTDWDIAPAASMTLELVIVLPGRPHDREMIDGKMIFCDRNVSVPVASAGVRPTQTASIGFASADAKPGNRSDPGKTDAAGCVVCPCYRVIHQGQTAAPGRQHQWPAEALQQRAERARVRSRSSTTEQSAARNITQRPNHSHQRENSGTSAIPTLAAFAGRATSRDLARPRPTIREGSGAPLAVRVVPLAYIRHRQH